MPITGDPSVSGAVTDFNGDGLGDLLLQKKTALNLFGRSGSNNIFTITALSSVLEKGQKIVTANDLTGDGLSEIILKKGKMIQVLTGTNYRTALKIGEVAKGQKIVGPK